MKTREAKLKPKYISVRITENEMCIEYDVLDTLSGKILTNSFINFNPSKQLLSMLEKEVDLEINKTNNE